MQSVGSPSSNSPVKLKTKPAGGGSVGKAAFNKPAPIVRPGSRIFTNSAEEVNCTMMPNKRTKIEIVQEMFIPVVFILLLSPDEIYKGHTKRDEEQQLFKWDAEGKLRRSTLQHPFEMSSNLVTTIRTLFDNFLSVVHFSFGTNEMASHRLGSTQESTWTDLLTAFPGISFSKAARNNRVSWTKVFIRPLATIYEPKEPLILLIDNTEENNDSAVTSRGMYPFLGEK